MRDPSTRPVRPAAPDPRRRSFPYWILLAVAALSMLLGATMAVLGAWLVICRVMVKTERGSRSSRPAVRVGSTATEVAPEPSDGAHSAESEDADGAGEAEQADDDTNHQGIPVVRDPNLWDPVPVTLPTYVDKEPAARRTVRTIDLGATGVWTSGRTAEDSALAREAEEAERAAKAALEAEQQRRAAGS